MIRFVIPAYNEHENIPRLLAALAPVARELGARVISLPALEEHPDQRQGE